MNYLYMNTPVGQLMLAADDRALHYVAFAKSRHLSAPEPSWTAADNAVLVQTRAQLAAYFDGALQEFSLPVAVNGTLFQRRVWDMLRTITFGTTASYRDVAAWIGKPAAVRAVGAANGRNPVPIIIPCHRVIGSSGKLTGFGGGLDVKAALLAHEQRFLDSPAWGQVNLFS